MLPTNRVQGCACHWCPIGVLTCVCLAFKWFCIWQGASVSCLRFTMADNGRQSSVKCPASCEAYHGTTSTHGRRQGIIVQPSQRSKPIPLRRHHTQLHDPAQATLSERQAEALRQTPERHGSKRETTYGPRNHEEISGDSWRVREQQWPGKHMACRCIRSGG
ncbi:hypothetical protein BGZ61DRAFT_437914 [Ilyonectria robusta]|uniref:uncharacterized protein n=1 Tax=Ilyonectria robusta TaxID=1079257 RepID=UPI001E8E46D9|nr:uncharacterized protein BGZ61DRAFT_437914 [Ilyonectria robusta]KAH8737235.1 hypothetical protein BGZ61DRAFT_437914 [Ilyonectria robusta]